MPIRILCAMFATLTLGLGCVSRELSQPRLYEDAPYEGEAEDIAESIELTLEKQKELAKANKGVISRGAHAKGHACLVGSLSPVKPRDVDTRQGLFKSDATYKVTLRFSNASPALKSDGENDPRGVALKLHGVPGPKLLAGAEQSTDADFLMVNTPTFPARTVADYNALLSSQIGYFLRHPILVTRALSHFKKPFASLLDVTYFSNGAAKWGNKAGKLRLRPCAPSGMARPETLENDYLAKQLASHFKEKPGCFVLEVQMQKDPVRQPVEDLTIPWLESETPFLPVAELAIPPQQFESTEQKQRCEALVYNPWRVSADHRPLGSLNRARKAIYEASKNERLK